jgi:predicted alpha/beta superfamily hydrolase
LPPVPSVARALRRHEQFHSSHLVHDRDVIVYVPPQYEESAQRYPVLYLQDGQNLFEPRTAFAGEPWRAGDTATALIESGKIQPVILVGIYNTGAQRINEYTPTYDRRRGGGEADAYGRLLVEELKPFIDTTYRTLTGRANSAIGGSSLGGLVSLYLGLKYPHVFGSLAAMSPSVWWDRRAILRDVRRASALVDRPRIWLDMGTAESRGAGSARRVVEDARLLKAGLVKAGWIDGENLHYEEVEAATHGERAWGDRFGRVLEWLFSRA